MYNYPIDYLYLFNDLGMEGNQFGWFGIHLGPKARPKVTLEPNVPIRNNGL
jgi:hypothetical protein